MSDAPRARAPSFSAQHRQAIAARRAQVLGYLPDVLATAVILLMTTQLLDIGKFLTLGWMACLGLLMLLRRDALAAVAFKWWPLLLLPIMACASAYWSILPSETLRYGVQLLVTAVAGVLIAKCLPPHRFAVALFVGLLIFCALSMLSDRTGPSPEGPVMIGLTGSKNSMAFVASMLLASAAAVIVLPNAHPLLKLLTLPAMLLGGYIVMVTSSATAVLFSIAAPLLILFFSAMMRLPTSARTGFIFAAALALAPIALLSDQIDTLTESFLGDVLHKDTTLSGRSRLWEKADDLIAAKPALGYGFQAWWLSGSPDSIALLRSFGQEDGRVFNFHNTFRQIAVDLGLVGVGLWIFSLIAVFFGGVRQFLFEPRPAAAFTFTCFLVLLAKSFTEVTMVAFHSQTVLLFACAAYCLGAPGSVAAPGPKRRTRRHMPSGITA